MIIFSNSFAKNKTEKRMSYIEVNFSKMILQFFSILQVLQIVDVNSMLAHCVAALDTTSFGHIWISCSENRCKHGGGVFSTPQFVFLPLSFLFLSQFPPNLVTVPKR